MPTNFPNSLDSFTNPQSGQSMQDVPHAQQHANANDAIEALQAKVGIDGSADIDSHDSKLAQLDNSSHAHVSGETPSGDLDGVNDTFTLAGTPVSGTLLLFYNGLLLRSGASNDYVISGATITFNEAPHDGAALVAHYVT